MYNMFNVNADLAKVEFEERLRQAAHRHLAEEFLQNRPQTNSRWLEKLSNLLINALPGRYLWVSTSVHERGNELNHLA